MIYGLLPTTNVGPLQQWWVYFSCLGIRYACIRKYMYAHPITYLREKKHKLKISSSLSPPSYPGKAISSSAGDIMCMRWNTSFCQETICDNSLLTVHRGNTQFTQLVVNTCLSILIALLHSILHAMQCAPVLLCGSHNIFSNTLKYNLFPCICTTSCTSTESAAV